ncbi:MAG: T9SS type A sorting domain-containing protein [Bacteroidota bacterium]
MKRIILFLSALLFTFLSFGQLRISEIRIAQPGADSDEYFEIQNMTGSPIDLNDPSCDYFYIVIGDDGSGSSGVIEEVTDLTGTIPANGFYVVAENSFSLGTADQTTSLSFENSDNVTHLLVKNFTGSNGDDLDSDDDCSLDAAFPGTVIDGVALIEEMNPPTNTECEYATDLSLPVVGNDGSAVPGHVGRNPSTGDWVIGDNDPDEGTDTPGGLNIPLPVELLSFIAQLQSDHSVLLKWSTASEEENDYFLVEKSKDGQKFQVIGKVKGAGNSLERQYYEFKDQTAKSGIHYYRLAQYDFDGSVERHQIIAITKKSKQSNVKIYPTLIRDELTINLEGDAQISVRNIAGALVKEMQVFGFTILDLSTLNSGIYFLVVEGENFIATDRIIKQ